ncbi:MAG: hypothetical protein ACK5ML_04960 [Lachnospiraceae bacterium]
MHVKSKQMAFLGILSGLITICIVVSSILEFNSLFFLCAAAYGIGIAIREFGIRSGFTCFAACLMLGIFLAPNKLYLLTFSVFSCYILGREGMYLFLGRRESLRHRNVFYLLGKWILFHAFLIPVLLFFPKLIYPGELFTGFYILIFLVAQVVWLIYDKGYDFFQSQIWSRIRNKISILK